MAKDQSQGKCIIFYFIDNDDDYICLTDIARYKNAEHTDDMIRNWLRNRNTIEFLGSGNNLITLILIPVEFDGFKIKLDSTVSHLTPEQWIEKTDAIGIVSKAGRYGGTYAHKDIAFEFASWISVEFKLYLIKEFQRLKEEEISSLDGILNAIWPRINYRIHTDAIKENLIPPELTKQQINHDLCFRSGCSEYGAVRHTAK